MATTLTGINATQVDTTAQFTPGIECEDPRTVTLMGNTIKYIQATGTITAGDAVQIDVTATAANRRFSVIRTSAVDQVLEGIANASMTANQFGWITVKGFFTNANVVTGAAAGAVLGTSATAGRLATSGGVAADANAQSAGRRALNLTLAASNLADILIGG